MSGDNDSEVVQSSEPWGPQQSYLKDIYGQAQANYRNPSTYYPGQTFVEMNDVTRQGLENQLAYAQGGMSNIAGQSQDALTSMFNAPDVANNPYISGVADVMTDRLNRNLSENIMPAIQGNFNMAGQYGGARQDLMRQNAGRDTQEALSQGLAGLYADAYGQGLDQQAKGLVTSPQTAQMGMMPGQTQSSIGETLRQEQYLPLNEDIARWNYEQSAPWDDLTRYAASVGGNVGSQVTGSTSQPSNTFGNILGGGMMGYGLTQGDNALLSGVNPWLGAGLGALGGLFF